MPRAAATRAEPAGSRVGLPERLAGGCVPFWKTMMCRDVESAEEAFSLLVLVPRPLVPFLEGFALNAKKGPNAWGWGKTNLSSTIL